MGNGIVSGPWTSKMYREQEANRLAETWSKIGGYINMQNLKQSQGAFLK